MIQKKKKRITATKNKSGVYDEETINDHRSRGELKSPIDSQIIDLIIEHYNIQSLEGRKEILIRSTIEIVEFYFSLHRRTDQRSRISLLTKE